MKAYRCGICGGYFTDLDDMYYEAIADGSDYPGGERYRICNNCMSTWEQGHEYPNMFFRKKHRLLRRVGGIK